MNKQQLKDAITVEKKRHGVTMKEMLKKWHQARGTKQTFWTKLINFWR